MARIDEIRRLIIDDVETLSWKENGGDDGSISTEAFGTNLIIVQTAQAHMQIEALLRTLDSRIFESGKDR